MALCVRIPENGVIEVDGVRIHCPRRAELRVLTPSTIRIYRPDGTLRHETTARKAENEHS